jgi:hypothetical protein
MRIYFIMHLAALVLLSSCNDCETCDCLRDRNTNELCYAWSNGTYMTKREEDPQSQFAQVCSGDYLKCFGTIYTKEEKNNCDCIE